MHLLWGHHFRYRFSQLKRELLLTLVVFVVIIFVVVGCGVGRNADDDSFPPPSSDPVTILAIFSEMNVENDLFALIFGESVMNDAVAIVLASTVETFITSGTSEASTGDNDDDDGDDDEADQLTQPKTMMD